MNQLKVYRHCASQSSQRSSSSKARLWQAGGMDNNGTGAAPRTRELEDVFPDAEGHGARRKAHAHKNGTIN